MMNKKNKNTKKKTKNHKIIMMMNIIMINQNGVGLSICFALDL